MTPDIIADYECWTGEGPLWHPDEQVVYWLDIPNGRLYQYDPKTAAHDLCYEYDGEIGGFTIQENGDLLLFKDYGTIRPWNADDGLKQPVTERLPDENNSRFNDVIADPRGRVFCGSMPFDEPAKGAGNLYRIDTDGSVHRLFEDLALPNGMGFTPDRRQLYFTETGVDKIYRFRYNQATGELADREIFIDVSDEVGFPDGMTVDREGYVWSARWNGGCLVRYSPSGEEDQRIQFPAKKISSITFGGPTYADAYVTSALGPGEGEPGSKETEGEGAGALFRFHPSVGGLPEFRSRISL